MIETLILVLVVAVALSLIVWGIMRLPIVDPFKSIIIGAVLIISGLMILAHYGFG